AGANQPTVTKQGFGQKGRVVVVGFLLRNSQEIALADIPYQATLKDAQGATITTVTDTLDLLMPGQEFGVVAEAAVPASAKVAAVDVTVSAGAPIGVDSALTLPVIANPSYGANAEVQGSQPAAGSVLISQASRTVSDLLVTALLFNDQGEIIGGGRGWVDGIDAGAEVGARVQALAGGEPTEVGMFAALTKGSIGKKPAAPKPPDNVMTLPYFGQKIQELPQDHVPGSKRVEYNSNPPTSGPHWQVWAAWGVYEGTTPFDEQFVHNLEHGGVVISYNPDKLSDEQFIEVFDAYKRMRKINFRIILAERKDLPNLIAVASWGYLLTLESADIGAIEGFFIAHYARGPECSGGICPP
ncbi:MAG TPA: DUF3105 domain-containing protein, partial [Herpetosiphonaceae bacterium]